MRGVMVETAFTVTEAVPILVKSCADVAVMVASPAPDGVNTPAVVIAPPEADHVTALLKFPVPETAAVHAEVWFVEIETGLHVTVIDETAEGEDEDPLTVTLAVATLLASCVEAAVMVAVPPPDGVNNPAGVIVPFVAV